MSYIENLEKQLFEMQDLKYRDFTVNYCRVLTGKPL